ncbi:MAG: hypothetical protein Q8L65_11800, partial [Burkholderiales bacterium]|nr:hypothetical protein [Burkholderiales bacterium]
DADGLPIQQVREYINAQKTIKGFPGAGFTENGSAVLEMECDILIPAALEAQITDENAGRINTKLIVEAANGPVTFEADEILRARNIAILPDALVNAGGVTVSYFEWIRNLSHIRFGRMERRYDEMRGEHLIAAMENVSQKQVPDWMRQEIVKGAAELDLVRSGLDDTMRHAYQELREVLRSNPKVNDYRTAAYVVAISKIARSYFDLGTY